MHRNKTNAVQNLQGGVNARFSGGLEALETRQAQVVCKAVSESCPWAGA